MAEEEEGDRVTALSGSPEVTGAVGEPVEGVYRAASDHVAIFKPSTSYIGFVVLSLFHLPHLLVLPYRWLAGTLRLALLRHGGGSQGVVEG